MNQQHAVQANADVPVVPLSPLERRRLAQHMENIYAAIERAKSRNNGRIPWQESPEGRYIDLEVSPLEIHTSMRALACGCTQRYEIYGLNPCPSWFPQYLGPMRIWEATALADHPVLCPERWQDPPCGKRGVMELDPARLRD